MMVSFKDLKKNLKKDFSGFRRVKLAVLGDNATQLLCKAIKGYGYLSEVDYEIYESDFNQIELEVYNPNSGLYVNSPDCVLIFYSTQSLLNQFNKIPPSQRGTFAKEKLTDIKELLNSLYQNIKGPILVTNFVEIDDGAYGNYANKIESSFLTQVRMVNRGLGELSIKQENLFINDFSFLHNQFGINYVFDSKMYYHASMVLSMDFIPVMAKNINDILQAINGKIIKCVVLDLDNTIWGGVIGDDGIENIQIGELGIGKIFTELQYWLKKIKQRGVLLAVCSKNDEDIAKSVFLKHPEMVLKLEDISVFIANWENKADNIGVIQSTLNIGFDSMVFLDDNPFERNFVRENIPDIIVPELPEDPAEYLLFLRSLNLFETASYSENDEKRTEQYQREGQRRLLQKNMVDENSFLKGLEMQGSVEGVTLYNLPRIAQLTQRSNQFNLRTQRYTETIVREISHSGEVLAFSLKDKFGESGLVSVVILKEKENDLFIDTWIMSCRVLKRGMENFVLNCMVEKAKWLGYKTLLGEYLPTPKNNLVKNHYFELGFKKRKCLWELDLSNYKSRKMFIKRV